MHACVYQTPAPQTDTKYHVTKISMEWHVWEYSWHCCSFYTQQWGMVICTSSRLHELSSCVHSHANERQKPELLFHTIDPWEPAITYSDFCREDILDCYFLFRWWIEEITVLVILLPAKFLTHSIIELWLNLGASYTNQGEGSAVHLGQTVEQVLVLWVRGTQIWGLANRRNDPIPCCRSYWVS